jgi:hypothetical protein
MVAGPLTPILQVVKDQHHYVFFSKYGDDKVDDHGDVDVEDDVKRMRRDPL